MTDYNKCWRSMEDLELSYPIGGTGKWYNHLENIAAAFSLSLAYTYYVF